MTPEKQTQVKSVFMKIHKVVIIIVLLIGFVSELSACGSVPSPMRYPSPDLNPNPSPNPNQSPSPSPNPNQNSNQNQNPISSSLNKSQIQQVTCKYHKDWTNPDVTDWDQTDLAEVGEICLFNVENPNPHHWNPNHWILPKDFNCGSDTTRIVMCQKAFDLFIKVFPFTVNVIFPLTYKS